jgi:hypothetical protein
VKRIALLGSVVTALSLAAPAAAFEPIEGVWRTETSTAGEYLIQRSGTGLFEMTTIKGNRHCEPDESGFRSLVTERMGLRGAGLDYAWDPVYRFGDCRVDGIGQGIVRVLSTDPRSYRHVLCGARPGTGAPQFDANYEPTASNTACRFAVRIRAPKAPVKARSLVRVRKAPRCTRRTRARGRVARLRLLNPVNEPVLSVRVRLGRRVLYSYDYPGKLRRLVKVRLPRRAARVRVIARTTSNKRFTVGRRYGRCAVTVRRR